MSKIVKSTGVVAASTMTSRVLGFVRDMLMANYFGARRVADVFFIAFMIPNLFRRLVAEGALTIAFIPVYTEYLVNEGEDSANKLANKIFPIQMFAILVIVSLGVVFTPLIMKMYFTSPEAYSLSVDLTRIMFPYLFFVGFVAFAMGILNSHKFFFSPAFAPVFAECRNYHRDIISRAIFPEANIWGCNWRYIWRRFTNIFTDTISDQGRLPL